MTATLLRGAPSLAVPATQNSAPVLEFRCLYTHDLRRKAKRWQDGYLRFHTFNKRVMAYDVLRNFVGDMHWRESGELEEGDELELEKGILVQVAELVGKIDQDLTGLFEKKIKGREEKASRAKDTGSSPVQNGMSSHATPAPLAPISRTSEALASVPMSQLLPKTLNAVLGTPRGPQGRAIITTKSPFQQKQRISDENASEEGRAPKRQRRETRTKITRHDTQQKSELRRPYESRPGIAARLENDKRQEPYAAREVIEIVSEDQPQRTKPRNTATARSKPEVPVDRSKHDEQSRPRPPAVSTTSHRPAKSKSPKKPTGNSTPPPNNDDEDLQGPPLRLVTHAPRRKFLCQAPAATNRRTKAPDTEGPLPEPLDDLAEFNKIQETRRQARLRKRQLPEKRAADETDDETIVVRRKDAPRPQPPVPSSRSHSFTATTKDPPQPLPTVSPPADMALEHGRMDQILLASVPQTHTSSLRRTQSEMIPPSAKGALAKKRVSKSQPQEELPRVSVAKAAARTGGAETGKHAATLETRRIDSDFGPWSKEAFDFFDWRPPDRGDADKCATREAATT